MRPSAEEIQWRNIRKVVLELADFCFGSKDDSTYGSCHIAITQSLTAKDGIRVKLEPLPINSNDLTAAREEAAVAWEVCASTHKAFANKTDALFSTRQADFIKRAAAARAAADKTNQ